MVTRFLDAGHRAAWEAGDEVYGGNPRLRTALEERGTGYVLAVACSHEVTTGAGKFLADMPARKVPKRAWQKLSTGAGAKGHRFYDWAVIDVTFRKRCLWDGGAVLDEPSPMRHIEEFRPAAIPHEDSQE